MRQKKPSLLAATSSPVAPEEEGIPIPSKRAPVLGKLPMGDGEPVYGDYHYVVDGQLTACPIRAGTVLRMKAELRRLGIEAREVWRCDMVAAGLAKRIGRS